MCPFGAHYPSDQCALLLRVSPSSWPPSTPPEPATSIFKSVGRVIPPSSRLQISPRYIIPKPHSAWSVWSSNATYRRKNSQEVLERLLQQAPSFYLPPLLLALHHADRMDQPAAVSQGFQTAIGRFPRTDASTPPMRGGFSLHTQISPPGSRSATRTFHRIPSLG